MIKGKASVPANVMAWFGYAFLSLPSLIVVPISFGNREQFVFPPKSLSLDLYAKYFSDGTWVQVTLQSLFVAACTAVAAVILGVSAAYGLERCDFRGKQLLTLFLLAPIFVPSVVLALGLYLYLSELHLAGSTFGLILSHILITAPFVMISASAALRQMDINIETAAIVMGARRVVILWRVTLPLIIPALVAGGLFAFLISFDEVVIAFFITNAQTETLPVKLYSSILFETSPVLAAVSTLMTTFSLLVCLVTALARRYSDGEVA
jgi:putative spermidine/putrescine transport system permease protein